MSAQRSPSVPNFKPNQLLNGWEVQLPLQSPKSEVRNQELDPPYSALSFRIPSHKSRVSFCVFFPRYNRKQRKLAVMGEKSQNYMLLIIMHLLSSLELGPQKKRCKKTGLIPLCH
jgi:hypothetical protein